MGGILVAEGRRVGAGRRDREQLGADVDDPAEQGAFCSSLAW